MAKINTTFDGQPAKSYQRQRDGMEQIIYGEASQLYKGGQHGHISFDPSSGSVDYWRGPNQEHSDYYIDGGQDDHTRI